MEESRQHIIDYPRHIHFSNRTQSVKELKNQFLRHNLFRHEFSPRLHNSQNIANMQLYSKISR